MNNQRTFVILLVGILVLGGFVYYINVNPDVLKEPSSATAAPLPEKLLNTLPENVSSLSVIDRVKGITFTAAVNEKGVWQIKEPQQGDADSARINSAVSTLTSLYPTRTFTESVNLTEFGILKPDYVVEIKQKNGAALKMEVGKKDATASGYYVRKEGAQNAVLIPTAALDSVLSLPSSPPLATPTVLPTLPGPLPSVSTPVPTATYAP
jgi:hypothetical protein